MNSPLKSKTSFVIPLVALTTLALSLPAWAARGDGTGNGGSPLILRIKLIKEFINSELRTDALNYMQTLDLDQIASGPARKALENMQARDVATDIQESSYVIKDSCRDVGGQAAGGAVANDLGGDICLSPRALAELGSSKAEIVGLIIHEHAHHFGYVDASYAIYKAVYQTVVFDNPEWSSADSSNTPVQPPVQPGNNLKTCIPEKMQTPGETCDAANGATWKVLSEPTVSSLVYFDIKSQLKVTGIVATDKTFDKAQASCPAGYHVPSVGLKDTSGNVGDPDNQTGEFAVLNKDGIRNVIPMPYGSYYGYDLWSSSTFNNDFFAYTFDGVYGNISSDETYYKVNAVVCVSGS